MNRHGRSTDQQQRKDGKCHERVPYYRPTIKDPMGQQHPWVSFPCGKKATKGTNCCDAHQVRR